MAGWRSPLAVPSKEYRRRLQAQRAEALAEAVAAVLADVPEAGVDDRLLDDLSRALYEYRIAAPAESDPHQPRASYPIVLPSEARQLDVLAEPGAPRPLP